MSREARRVPADWQHPKNGDGRLIPMRRADDPNTRAGEQRMPVWPEAERTHWQMYETTTAGTPISPACASPEELAKWLADHHADAWGGLRLTEKQWLAMIQDPAGNYVTPEGEFVARER